MDQRPSQGHRQLPNGALELWAPTEEALFREAATAVIERVAAGTPPGTADRRYLEISGHGPERLRRWVEAVLAAAGDGFLFADADLQLAEGTAAALVNGRSGRARPAPERVAGVDLLQHDHGVWARIDFAATGADFLALPQPYEELDHTADLGVRVRGAGAEETLARLVCVFGRLLAGTDDLAPGERTRIGVPGGDLPLAAADILRDLLYRFATERVVPAACRTLRIDGPTVEVEVALAPWDPGERGADIKAITLHQLRFEPDGDGWLAQVVFDV